MACRSMLQHDDIVAYNVLTNYSIWTLNLFSSQKILQYLYMYQKMMPAEWSKNKFSSLSH